MKLFRIRYTFASRSPRLRRSKINTASTVVEAENSRLAVNEFTRRNPQVITCSVVPDCSQFPQLRAAVEAEPAQPHCPHNDP